MICLSKYTEHKIRQVNIVCFWKRVIIHSSEFMLKSTLNLKQTETVKNAMNPNIMPSVITSLTPKKNEWWVSRFKFYEVYNSFVSEIWINQ